ncbi:MULTISPECIES: ATP-dependent helicase [Caldisericum]|jgi:DNA helicase-2/ATP-dependent DNA helicase PcrA|uniref:DNA 3'-5' helicase n=1 Tax=Caldisericum exile TaxID=693075 RepID=A0A2J6WEX3_9BACT|nr:MAG: ATP-dependent DNA helicase PcrA [Caldisericum exile]
MKENYLNELNPAQLEAVTYIEGPLLVYAGAGSGKTKVITYKIAYLIDSIYIRPSQILAVTFTNKAAKEMKERTEHIIGEEIKDLFIGTFHSICAKILRKEAKFLGYKENFTILDEDDSVNLIKDIMKDLNFDPKYINPNEIKDYISKAKMNLIDASKFSSRDYFEEVVSKVYKKYEKTLRVNNALDFDDLIMLTIKLFQENEQILHYYQAKFRHILVDEYQDVNRMQYEFIKILTEKTRRFTLVGDDDQSIYSFRGASSEFIDKIYEDFPDLKVVKLEKNYRSPQEILNIANKLIKHNKRRTEKELFSDISLENAISFYEALDELDEARFVVNKIKTLKEEKDYRNKDFAVLYRTNFQSRAFEEYLIQEGIPYQVIGGQKFYGRAEIKDIIAYLTIVNNPNDNISFKRIVNIPPRKIGEKTIEELEKISGENEKSLFESIEDYLKIKESKPLKEFYELIKELQELSLTLPLPRFVEEVVSKTKYIKYLQEKFKEESDERIGNVKEFENMVINFTRETEDANLSTLLTQISLITSIDESKEDDRVSLMTLHAAKGLEFPVVFLVGLEEGLLPHFRSLETTKDIEEERRLCYVGITRAKEQLFLIYALRRSKFGSLNPTKTSRFLQEMEIFEYNKEKEEQHTFAIRKGDMVLHRVWGLGKVLDVAFEGDIPYATIQFLKIGVKNLDLRYAPLEKVR